MWTSGHCLPGGKSCPPIFVEVRLLYTNGCFQRMLKIILLESDSVIKPTYCLRIVLYEVNLLESIHVYPLTILLSNIYLLIPLDKGVFTRELMHLGFLYKQKRHLSVYHKFNLSVYSYRCTAWGGPISLYLLTILLSNIYLLIPLYKGVFTMEQMYLSIFVQSKKENKCLPWVYFKCLLIQLYCIRWIF